MLKTVPKKQMKWQIYSAFFLAFLAVSCTFKTPSVEHPPQNNKAENLQKSFFVNPPDAEGKIKPKTFICAYAPEAERGVYGEAYTLHAAATNTDHCNLEWKITEKYLIGRKIDPTFPNDRERWKEIITVPITRHYHYERRLDEYGRQTNVYIKNDQKDSWADRPYFDLDMSGLTIHEWAYKMFLTEAAITSVEEVEIDAENGFLAFSVEAMDAHIRGEMQGRFRFNFKEFVHNSQFEKTPFHQNNSKKINILHLLGKRVEGLEPILYAGKWDLSKTHPVYLNGFPEEYKTIAVEVVDLWNQALQEIGAVPNGHKPFQVSSKELQHAFDLRYPSITWVSDMRISASSPLGVGLVYSDVKNGEILWGGITLYGGLLEHYIQRFSPSEVIDAQAKQVGPLNLEKLYDKEKLFASYSKSPFNMNPIDYIRSQEARLQIAEALSAEKIKLQKDIQEVKRTGGTKKYGDISLDSQQLNELMMSLDKIDTSKPVQSQQTYLSAMGEDVIRPASAPQELDHEEILKKFLYGNNLKRGTVDESQSLKVNKKEDVEKALMDRMNSTVFDSERTFADVAQGWHLALESLGGDYSFNEAMRVVIKWLIIHEYGHFLGLGHQFSGNILPEKGSVPEKYFNEQLALVKNKQTNTTSVMDYLSPRSEVFADYNQIVPGPHDKLVLRYLYNREIPGFRPGLSDFVYTKFSADSNGLIPETFTDPNGSLGELKTTYFLACNDLEASLSSSPYCARFDRGYDSTTIAQNTIEDFFGTLVAQMNAFTGAKGGNPEYAQNLLFYRSYTTFMKLRTFYDHMRDRIKNTPAYRKAFDKIRKNSQYLYEFSEACLDPETASENAKPLFKTLVFKDPNYQGTVKTADLEDLTEIHNLCVANKVVLDQFNQLFNRSGSDHTKMNYDNAVVTSSITGGDAKIDWGRVFGTWTELSSSPLRWGALWALTTKAPWIYAGFNYFSIPRYSDAEASYAYYSLYPREFTRVLNTLVQKNLRFGGEFESETTEMGMSLLYLRYFLNDSFYGSNDNQRRFPSEYIENLRSQIQMSLDIVPVILTNVETAGKPKGRIFQYKASYFEKANRVQVDIPYAYLLPERKVIAKGKPGQLLFPITKFRYLDEKWGFVWAYELRVNYKYDDLLSGESPKNALIEEAISQINNCVANNDKGLQSFFNANNPEFEGFSVLPGIGDSSELHIRFNESVKKAFATYYDKTGANPATCEEASKGLGLIISAGALLNGYWLPETFDYMAR